ncbi:MAG TPA: LCP family protein [Gaiellales bacterium]
MTVYAGGAPPRRPRRRKRRWLRVALWSIGTILVLLLAAAAAVFYMFYGDYNKLTSPPKAFVQAEHSIDPLLPEANAPAIALVIGSDHRYTDGSAPARSDTLMLVRIDPRTHLISLLSLPRDLWVDIPGFGQDKINAAFSDGGPKTVLQTVKQLTGLKVNYLIGVNFHSFTSLVNDMGGVYVPVDQAYIHTQAENDALPEGERWSVINVLPGYQLLTGKNALAFSRFRHTDSDFYRNARQQTFLHAFEQKAAQRFHGISLSDLGAIKDIIHTIASNVDIAGANGGIGLHTMLNYATLAYSSKHIIASRLQATTGMIGAASVVEATPEAIHQAVFAFTHPQDVPSPTNQLPNAPTKPKHKKHRFAPAVDPTTVSISVLNGTLKTGEAASTAQQLGKFGYKTSSGNAPTQTYNQTWVYYAPGNSKAAADVARIIGGNAPTAAMPSAIASAEDVVVVVGSDFGGKLAIAAPKSSTTNALPPDITPDGQAYLTEFRSMRGKVTFPLLYPTVTQNSSEVPSTYPIRAYHIPNAGHHWSSLYAYFDMPSRPGASWGIQETRFTDAPILADPSATRKIGHRTYRFYFNGSHIHMIAFTQSGTAYWVQNTLLEDLSNADMVAIAKSLHPVP